jgi:aryl-alcohol dehydrogenase-like predicted oxidoreductase
MWSCPDPDSILARYVELDRSHSPHPQAYSPLAGGSLTGKYQDGGNGKSRFNLFPGALRAMLLAAGF